MDRKVNEFTEETTEEAIKDEAQQITEEPAPEIVEPGQQKPADQQEEKPKKTRRKDLTGMVFGAWTVLREAKLDGVKDVWVCRCACGKESVVRGGNLRGCYSRSCGCMRKKNKDGEAGKELAKAGIHVKETKRSYTRVTDKNRKPEDHEQKETAGSRIMVPTQIPAVVFNLIQGRIATLREETESELDKVFIMKSEEEQLRAFLSKCTIGER